MLPPVQSYPAQQAVGSSTFRPPPLDGSLTMVGMYDWHMTHTPNHPLFVYKSESTTDVRRILFPEAIRAIHRSARYVQSCIKLHDPGHVHNREAPSVIGILGNIDTIRYFTLFMGIMRAGYQAFPISTRNSALGVANLLAQTKCSFVIVSEDEAMRTLAASATSILKENATPSAFHQFDVPPFESLFPDKDDTFQPLPEFTVPTLDTAALILHSSGSTAFPKAITFTHKILIQWTLVTWHGELDLCGEILAAHSIPMFHSMGLIMTTWAASCGLAISCFRPGSPAIVPKPDIVLVEAVQTRSSLLLCVPAWLESWSHDEALIPILANFKAIIFGGAPLNKEVGDFLCSKGVNLLVLFGSTETGSLVRLMLKASTLGVNWDYFQLSPHSQIHLKPRRDISDKVFEAIVIDSNTHTPCVINSDIEGKPAYATNDLLVQHPTESNLWKIYGRADDQIILSTGEKTNPSPIEGIFMRDSKGRIASAVMFGRGRFNNGILLELKDPHNFDPSDTSRLAEFRNEIWSLVEEANIFAPSHSRLFKEMILIAKKSKPFEYTPKGTARRHVVVANYEQEIDEAYIAIERSALLEYPLPKTWMLDQNLIFLRDVIQDVLKRKVQDTDDLFEHGCDSLQATWIRNKIREALRQSAGTFSRKISQNFVYDYPSILQLAKSLQLLSRSDDTKNDGSKMTEMQSLIQEYTKDFPVHKPSKESPTTEVAVLTGATGSLGAHILVQLLNVSTFSRIYALNRKSENGSESVRQRQMAALEDRGLDPKLIDSPKIVLVECDYAAHHLGIPEKLYEEIRTSATVIIHNAWILDFNRSLLSFRPIIASVRHLIDLALGSPFPTATSILFTSTVGVTLAMGSEATIYEEPIENAELLDGSSGYSQSKWVSERILEEATRTRLLRTVNIRVGQVCGGSTGAWNIKEWFPAIVKSGRIIGCLPGGEDRISWFPVHVGAAAIVDFRRSSEQTLHLNHPRPARWSTVMNHVSKILDVPTVPYSEWLQRLKESARTSAKSDEELARENPALKIMGLWNNCNVTDGSQGEREALGFPKIDLTKALKVSQTLSDPNLPQLGPADVDRWFLYWKQKGYLT